MILYNKKYDNGSECRITLLLPEVKFHKHMYNIHGDNISTKLISFANRFCLTSSNSYINIELSVLGFGMRMQIIER